MITEFLRWDTLTGVSPRQFRQTLFFQFPIVKNYFQYKERGLDTYFAMCLSIYYSYTCANPVMQGDAPGLHAF